jgi:hypothetical protein
MVLDDCETAMNDGLMVSGSWQEWMVVLGYVSFMVFVAWRVLTSK